MFTLPVKEDVAIRQLLCTARYLYTVYGAPSSLTSRLQTIDTPIFFKQPFKENKYHIKRKNSHFKKEDKQTL